MFLPENREDVLRSVFYELDEVSKGLEDLHVELLKVSRELVLARAELAARDLFLEEQEILRARNEGPEKDPRTGRPNREYQALLVELRKRENPEYQRLVEKVRELEFRKEELEACIRARNARLRALEAQAELLASSP